MRVLLADLYHVQQRHKNPDTNPFTVPLGIGYLASTLKHHLSDIDVRLFRDPDLLLKEVRRAKPDLVGFSFCSWNTNLTQTVMEVVRHECPSTTIVAGGPSVDDLDEPLRAFLARFPQIDFAIPNEGETGLLTLVRHLEKSEPLSVALPGVAYLNDHQELVRGPYQRPVVPSGDGGERLSSKQVRELGDNDIEIPSPYLDGTLDQFLEDGLVPIVQTMRGCPYQCQFCVSGATAWNRMRGFALDRVKSEIDYALGKSRSKDLILTDENWGILGDRDVALAHFIMDKHRSEGLPSRLYYYTAKIVTPASLEIVETVAPIAWIAEFSMSFQSTNPDTRKEIKRTNISAEKVIQHTSWARQRNIVTSSEMIYGFPYETPATFFSGIETLASQGIDRVTVYPLQLFPGIDLASSAARQAYAFKTRFRLADCGYGIYDDGELFAAEAEEIVVSHKWSSEDDYLTVRRYAFFQQILIGRQYFSDIIALCRDLKVGFEPLVEHLASYDYENQPALGEILRQHRADSEAELFDSSEELLRHVQRRIMQGEDIGGTKVNLIYLAKVMSLPQAVKELIDVSMTYFEKLEVSLDVKKALSTFLTEILPHRIAVFVRDPLPVTRFKSIFDYDAWKNGHFSSASDLIMQQPKTYVARTSDELIRNLEGFERSSHRSLQGLIDKTRRKYLLREIRSADPGGERSQGLQAPEAAYR